MVEFLPGNQWSFFLHSFHCGVKVQSALVQAQKLSDAFSAIQITVLVDHLHITEGGQAGVSAVAQHKTMRTKTFKRWRSRREELRWIQEWLKTSHYTLVFRSLAILCLRLCSTSRNVQLRFFHQFQQFIFWSINVFYQTLMWIYLSPKTACVCISIHLSLFTPSQQ